MLPHSIVFDAMKSYSLSVSLSSSLSATLFPVCLYLFCRPPRSSANTVSFALSNQGKADDRFPRSAADDECVRQCDSHEILSRNRGVGQREWSVAQSSGAAPIGSRWKWPMMSVGSDQRRSGAINHRRHRWSRCSSSEQAKEEIFHIHSSQQTVGKRKKRDKNVYRDFEGHKSIEHCKFSLQVECGTKQTSLPWLLLASEIILLVPLV